MFIIEYHCTLHYGDASNRTHILPCIYVQVSMDSYRVGKKVNPKCFTH